MYHKTDKLLNLITFFKNKSFSDEAEYRLSYLEDKALFNEVGLKLAPKRFRVRNKMIVPYVKSDELYDNLHIEKNKIKIKSITLGPNSHEQLSNGVRELLDSNGYEYVTIKYSKVPYRK